jgi:hypothetical protein
MKNIIKLAAVVAVAMTLAQSTQAIPIPITGNIGFSGIGNLNTGDANTASQVSTWSSMNPDAFSGTFLSAGSLTPGVTLATFPSAWNFNSGAIPSFWSVGGFTFNLTSSTVVFDAGGFLNISLTGVMQFAGFSDTPYNGAIQFHNPSDNAGTAFSTNPSFFPVVVPVPDGASTATLLGLCLTGAALLRRKLTA